MSNNYLP